MLGGRLRITLATTCRNSNANRGTNGDGFGDTGGNSHADAYGHAGAGRKSIHGRCQWNRRGIRADHHCHGAELWRRDLGVGQLRSW